MAIIYTYPTKIPTLDDKVLLSDAADGNKTKNAALIEVKEALDVVDNFNSQFGTFISGIYNKEATGRVDIGTVDLTATGTPSSTNFLKGNNTWSSVDLASDVGGVLPINSGGTNASTANDALNNLLPSQTGNSGKILSTDGTNTSWVVDNTEDASGSQGSVQFNNGGNFLGTDKFLYSEGVSENLLEIKGATDPLSNKFKNGKIKLGGTSGAFGGNPPPAGGEIELQAGGLSVGDNSVTISAPRSPIATPYSIKLPTSPPTSNNRILESDSSGDLSWIDTPSIPNLSEGQIFIGNAGNQTSTLGIGASDTVLKSNGTTASWVDSLHHEQGTFSPTISTSSGTYTGGFTNNTTYTVVGDIVTVFWHVQFSGTGGAGSINFTLPVNADASATAVGSFFPMKNTLKPTGENNIVGMKVSGSAATLLDFSDVNFKLDTTAGTPVINSGQLIVGTLTYRKA